MNDRVYDCITKIDIRILEKRKLYNPFAVQQWEDFQTYFKFFKIKSINSFLFRLFSKALFLCLTESAYPILVK